MNIISEYEQGYISFERFKDVYFDYANESLECLCSEERVDFYAKMALSKTKCTYYIKPYTMNDNRERKSLQSR